MKYEVTVTQYHYYEVDADNESEAKEIAIKEFESDMCNPIADTHYDDVEVEEAEGLEE